MTVLAGPGATAEEVLDAPPEEVSDLKLNRLTLRPIQDAGFADVDWESVASRNYGVPSTMPLVGSWGMSISSGRDRLEEGEPTLDLTRHGPGFTDTFLFVSAHYRLNHWTQLFGRVTGIRAQDQPIADVVTDADVSAFTVGVSLRF